MKRCAWVALAWLALASAGNSANPVDVDVPVNPYAATHLIQTFENREKVKVLAIGKGKIGYGGLYVFDSQGNCVTWDDPIHAGVEDDLAVEFVAAQKGGYTIVVRNLGQKVNPFTIIVK